MLTTRTNRKYNISDILIVLFHLSQSRITVKIPDLHQVIFNLYGKYKDFFGEMIWQNRTFGPYCEKIHDCLMNMEMARLICELNDNYYYIYPKLHNRALTIIALDNQQSIFTDDEMKLLREMALDFAQELSNLTPN